MSDCKQCGKCCSTIWLPQTRAEVEAMAKRGHPDAVFVLTHWKPISVKQAAAINPVFVQQIGHDANGTRLTDKEKSGHLWRCTKLNHRTNLCRVHAHKPQVCSGFPWYGKDIAKASPFVGLPDCAFALKKNYVDGVTSA